MKIMRPLLKNLSCFCRETAGAVAVETALVVSILLVPMLLWGVEVYAYKSRTAEMNRVSYQAALSMAASPNADRTTTDIVTAYRQYFPSQDDTIAVDSYCTCGTALQSYTQNNSQNSCESSCPNTDRITWKKVTITRTYDPIVNSTLVGNAPIKASHLFRNS